MRWVAVAAVAMIACTAHRPSDDLRCDDPSQCTDGRDCVGGYCVFDPSSPDASVDADPRCPSPCTSCTGLFDDAGGFTTCVVDCNQTNACQGDVECPPNMACEVSCNGTNACSHGVDCSAATACTISCQSTNACGNDVTCGPGPCTVSCVGNNACDNGVDCGPSCACDVTCLAGACDNPPSCTDAACETTAPLGCSSTAGPACDTCN